MQETFSERHDIPYLEVEITVREDAPQELRYAVLQLAKGLGMTPNRIREVVCQTLLVQPDPNNWSDYPNVWGEVEKLIEECLWPRIYDIIEELYIKFSSTGFQLQYDNNVHELFESRINIFFREHGIGWKMNDGKIEFRGSENFNDSTDRSLEVLSKSGRRRAYDEMQEAIADISRRPPDVTGAIHHAMAALESVARDVTGQPEKTLGKLVPRIDLPSPLDKAVGKLWGYASQYARHGREDRTVNTIEAELVVSISASLCTFLAQQSARQK